jgi:hypothetical protein
VTERASTIDCGLDMSHTRRRVIAAGSSLQSGGVLRLTDELKPGNANALNVFALPN